MLNFKSNLQIFDYGNYDFIKIRRF